MKKELKAGRKPIPPPKGNGMHAVKPRLRPIEELVRKICRTHHTKGILAQ